jgi:hypothetical protein
LRLAWALTGDFETENMQTVWPLHMASCCFLVASVESETPGDRKIQANVAEQLIGLVDLGFGFGDLLVLILKTK